MKRLKSDTRDRMGDETYMPTCVCRLRKLKRTLTFTKTKKKLFCYFVGVLCIFFPAEHLYFESQTNRKLKNLTLESKIASGVQQKLGLLEQQTSLLIAMDFLFVARKGEFFSQTAMWPLMLAVLDHPEPTNTVLHIGHCTFYKGFMELFVEH